MTKSDVALRSDEPSPDPLNAADTLARRNGEHSLLLQPLTAALLECVTVAEVVSVVVERGVAVLGAEAGMVVLVSDDGLHLEVIGARGYASEVLEAWPQFPLTPTEMPLPLSDAVREQVPLFFTGRADWEARYPRMFQLPTHPAKASASLPLIARGRALGGLHFSFPEECAAFSPEDQGFLQELARQCALTLDRALLLEQARAAEEARERALRQRESVLESIGEMFYALDADFRFTYVNRHVEKVWGQPRRELIGKDIWTVFPQFVGTDAYAGQTEAMRERRVVRFETILPILDRWVECVCYPTEEGGISAYFQDIQERKTAEETLGQSAEALRISEERYRRIVETASEGIWVLDADGRTQFANRKLAALLGFQNESEMTGTTLYEFMSEPWQEIARAKLASTREGVAEPFELLLQRRDDGKLLWSLVSATPITDAQGSFTGSLSMWTDITSRKQAESKVRRLFDSSVVGVIFWNLNTGKITDANDTFLATVGYTRDDLTTGMLDFRAMTPPEWTERNEQGVASIREEGYAHAYEKEYFRKDGSRVPILIGGTRFEDSGAEGFSYILDITEQKVREIERRALLLQQRHFLRDVLSSVTEGRLALCDDRLDLPRPLAFEPTEEPVVLTLQSLKAIRAQTEAAAHSCGLPDERTLDLVTGVAEAAMNAVRYAGGGMATVYSDVATQRVQVWIEDTGAGIDLSTLPRATLERGFTTGGGFGHGFWLMLKTCDRVYLLTGPNGTTVVLEQQSNAPEPPWLRTTP